MYGKLKNVLFFVEGYQDYEFDEERVCYFYYVIICIVFIYLFIVVFLFLFICFVFYNFIGVRLFLNKQGLLVIGKKKLDYKNKIRVKGKV